MTQDRRTSSGRSDSSLIERAEALIDEAVGRAAKGSYGEAAEKAQQALAIDPDNTVARDLLDSYRHQVTDDDERRRRRRSIAAAAAAIEEMVESERLDEASSATDALVMQFGLDAPVEDLRQRIAEARASHLDFDDLDAAIDKIRVGDGRPSQAGRNEPGGAVAAEIEEHLRAGRLDQANRALARLEAEPAAIERAAKLRTRIEEALHVAAEHRSEEEILIATAAIEDRIRRGNIDDAAVQLADLARRHGSSAPIAELNQRLAEARALAKQTTIAAVVEADGETAEPFTTTVAGAPVFHSMVEEESSGRGRLIAIVVAVAIALAAGAWWLMQRGGEAAAPPVAETLATEEAASTDGVTETGALVASPAVDAGSAESTGALDAAPRVDAAAPRVPPSANGSAAVVPPARTIAAQRAGSSPAAAADRSGATEAAPTANLTAAEPPPPAAPPTSPNASDTAPAPAVEERSAIADTAAPPADPPQTTEVVVEALPASASPPPAPAPPPPEPSAPSSAAEAAPAPAESAPSSASSSDSARPEPATSQQQAAVAEPPRAAAPPPAAASGPVLLGCGDPGVVCVKALQVPQPRYPAAGRTRRLSGNVVVMALVDESGRVVQTRVDSGSFAFFNEAALDAARRATFQPATRQGVPGQSWARLTFKFDQQ